MKTSLVVLMIITMLISIPTYAQEVLELKEIESLTEFWDLYHEIEPINESDTSAAIKIFEDAFNKTNNSFAKSYLISELGTLYNTPEQFDKCLSMCEELINDGMVVFFESRGRKYPSFTSSLAENEKFPALLKKNNDLQKKIGEGSKAEYYIQKPTNYDENKKYPLLIIFHGGAGSIPNVQHFWKSPILNEKYIVAIVQGKIFLNSVRRRFGATGTDDVKKVYEQITKDYSIDTTKVILGGQSAGGMLAIDLAINNHLSIQGLILAFSVKPRAFGADEILSAGINGLRVSMICGENDWALERQKEMSVIFDKLLVANRIVIYPDLGHNFPDDFSKDIKKSIEFINSK